MEEQITTIPVQEPETEQPAVEAEAVVKKSFCGGCGMAIPEGMKFCPNCGRPVNSTVSAAPVKKSGTKKPLIIGAVVAVLVVIVALVVMLAPEKVIPATDLVLSAEKFDMKQEETVIASCTVYPQDATDKTVVWTSSDPTVATVNSIGSITAVGKGDCIITVQCGTLTKMIKVSVKPNVDFKALYNELDSDVKYGWEVGSDGTYLSADDNVYNLDDYSNNSIWESIKDMNKKLGLPSSLTEDMLHTTWSMGRQNQSFPDQGVEVTWTYHPDKGMEVTYKLLH